MTIYDPTDDALTNDCL